MFLFDIEHSITPEAELKYDLDPSNLKLPPLFKQNAFRTFARAHPV